METLNLDSLYVLKLEDCYSFKVPGFEVLTVKLRRARVQRVADDGSANLIECLINDNIASKLRPPIAITPLDCCYIKV